MTTGSLKFHNLNCLASQGSALKHLAKNFLEIKSKSTIHHMMDNLTSQKAIMRKTLTIRESIFFLAFLLSKHDCLICGSIPRISLNLSQFIPQTGLARLISSVLISCLKSSKPESNSKSAFLSKSDFNIYYCFCWFKFYLIYE